MEFPPEVSNKLGYHVYLYINPYTDEVFYIGKGIRNRAFHHLSDTSESEKVEEIRDIRKRGVEPKIEILRYGMTESEAAIVEASSFLI